MIIYEAEGVKFPNIKKRETTSWIRKVAATYGKKVGEIGYLFVNDDKTFLLKTARSVPHSAALRK